MINKVLWAVIALPVLVSLLSCGSDESQSQLLPMEKPIFKLGYPKGDAQHPLLAVTDSQIRVLARLIDVTGDDEPENPICCNAAPTSTRKWRITPERRVRLRRPVNGVMRRSPRSIA